MENQNIAQSSTLIDLLDSWGIDLREGSALPVRVLRHAGDDGAVNRFFRLGSEEFEWYQGSQKIKIYGDAKILVSFVKTVGYEAEFVGVYRVQGVEEGHIDPPLTCNIPEELLDKCDFRYHYQLSRETQFDQFRGRIRILWDKVESRWKRQHQDANRQIVAIKDIHGNWLKPSSRESLLEMGITPAEDDWEYSESGSYKEGAKILRSHFTVERNGKLIRDCKHRFRKNHHGRLFCEACRFDFLAVYGEEYIECHHTIPVHKLPSNGSTRIEDMALLCSNCHRMIHRRKEWMSIDQLRLLLDSRKMH